MADSPCAVDAAGTGLLALSPAAPNSVPSYGVPSSPAPTASSTARAARSTASRRLEELIALHAQVLMLTAAKHLLRALRESVIRSPTPNHGGAPAGQRPHGGQHRTQVPGSLSS